MKKILILGTGALGSNLAANIAADLRNEVDITVLDYDTVEERNVQAGTQFYMRDQIGMKKTEALQYNIYKWFGKQIEILTEMLNDEVWFTNRHTEYDLVIDCFDNENSRQLVQDYFSLNTLDFNLLHCGFSDQMTFEVCWAEHYEVPEDKNNAKDVCEMLGAGSFIKMAAGAAAYAVNTYIFAGQKINMIGNRFSVRKMV